MSEEQITDLFQTLVGGLKAAGAAAGSGDRGTRSEPEPIPDLTDEELKEMFDPSHAKFNPKLAIARIAEKNYGPILGDISSRATAGLYNKIATEYPDFKNYQNKVADALKDRDPRTVSEQVIFGTYLTMKGMDVVQQERKKSGQAAGTGTIIDKSGKDGGNKDDDEGTQDLTAVEKQVAKKMFPNSTDPEKDYRDAHKRYLERTTVSVPVGRNEKGEVVRS